MSFFNSLFLSTRIKNAISIAESFLDDYYPPHAAIKIKPRAINLLKTMDGDKELWKLESEHIALLAILYASTDLFVFRPDHYDSFAFSPPYDALKRLIDDVLSRMQKLDYMNKKEIESYLQEIEKQDELSLKKHKEDFWRKHNRLKND